MNLHPSLLEIVVKEISDLKDISEVAPVIKTSLMSKQLDISEFLSQLIASACSKHRILVLLFS